MSETETKPKETGILFKPAMIAALTAKPVPLKDVTRRIIKKQPSEADVEILERSYGGEIGIGGYFYALTAGDMGFEKTSLKSPYGGIGDLLWVKEPWRLYSWDQDCTEILTIQYKDGSTMDVDSEAFWKWIESDTSREAVIERYMIQCHEDCKKKNWPNVDEEYPELYKRWDKNTCPTRWRSPLFMSKWASRLWYENVDVRPERLQDISHKDIWREGAVIGIDIEPKTAHDDIGNVYRREFALLWDLINGKRKDARQDCLAYRWKDNPYVWRIEMKETNPPVGKPI